MNPPDFDLAGARVGAILNAGSGKQEGPDIAALLRERLAPRVATLDLLACDDGARLPELAAAAQREGYDLIIAAGGDGTQAAVAGALAGTGTAMGVIPSGTFNYFARDLGVGETPEEALDTLLDAVPRRLDLAEVNGRIFLNNVSFGVYPDILKTRETIYRRWGRSRVAAYGSVLLALRNLRHPLRLTVRAAGEERQFDTALAFVARNRFQLSVFGLEGAEAVSRGELAVLVARAETARGLLGAALRLAFGRSDAGSDFALICTDRLRIETRPAHQVLAIDGERQAMAGPFEVVVRPAALTVLVPRNPAPENAGE